MNAASLFTLPLHVLSVSHRRATAQALGALALDADACAARLRDWSKDTPALVLSTCNRLECWWWGANATPVEPFTAWVTAQGVPVDSIRRMDADRAVRHAMAVSAGLDSAVLGEADVLGQVRDAWREAQRLGASSTAFDGAMQRVLEGARRIRRTSDLDADARTIGSAVVERANAHYGLRWPTLRVLVVGSGAAARSTLEALRAVNPAALRVAGRTPARVAAVAERSGATPVPWDACEAAISASDVVVFALRGSRPLLNADQVRALGRGAGSHTALWLDLGVPPNVAPESEAARVLIVRLDQLLAGAPSASGATAGRAHAALQRELARYDAELHRRALAERLRVVPNRAEDIAREEVQSMARSIASNGALPSDTYDELARRIARRVLHPALQSLSASHDP